MTPEIYSKNPRAFAILIAVIAAWSFYGCTKANATGDENLTASPSYSAPTARHRHQTRGDVIGGRPAGCPHRFCGCALSIKIFGAIKPKLNLAINWARYFPRTSPQPGAVAVRNGHVFQLIAPVNGSIWLVYDPNSGGGRIRIHQRSIASYVTVAPHARVAMR